LSFESVKSDDTPSSTDFSKLHILVVDCFGLNSKSVSGLEGEAVKWKTEIENTIGVS
jgi:hypothetical protein